MKFLLLLLLSTFPAFAHGDADWIRQQNLKNIAGELCCGEHDCHRLADGDVSTIKDGFYIKSLLESVPENKTIFKSPSGYWYCKWNGQRKCFIAPSRGM